MTFVMQRYLCAVEWWHRLPKCSAMAMLSHRQGWSLAVLLVFLPNSWMVARASDAAVAEYRTGAAEVRVTFFATDENHRRLETIRKDDFAVVDNGVVIRDFRSLMRAQETSLDISLLVDASESVAPRFRETTDRVARLLANNHAEDNLSLITFAGMQPAVVCAGDCGNPGARQRLLAIKAAGATPLFDALTYTARTISKRREPKVRPVVILFSDGDDTISMASAREALDAMLAAGAVLYAVNSGSSVADSKSMFLQRMAEATGGRSFSMRQEEGDALEAVLGDLRASYVVTYQLPSHLVGFHSLRILPKHNLNLQFHCRRGYYYDEKH